MKNALLMLSSVVDQGLQESFVVTTEDGKIIVVDGGHDDEAEKLLGTLKSLSGKEIPHVDGWFLSHPHGDHINAFLNLTENHRGEFSVGSVYYAFPSIAYANKYEPADGYTSERFYSDLPLFCYKAKIVSENDVIDVGAARFEILYSFDPEFTMNALNNASLIFKMTLNNKTVLFLNDAGIQSSEKAARLHKEKLKCDFCQLAHHGQNGTGKDVYKLISPKAALWCTPKWLWDNDAGDGFDTYIFKTVEVRGWMKELGVKENYVMKDGDVTIEF